MKAIDIEADNFQRALLWKGNSKKTIVRFYNRKFSKRALYNKKKLACGNKSTAGLRNSTRLFISDNLTDYNNKLVFKCRQLKRASLIHSLFARDGVVHIMKSDHSTSENIIHTSKIVKLFSDFDFHDEK